MLKIKIYMDLDIDPNVNTFKKLIIYICAILIKLFIKIKNI